MNSLIVQKYGGSSLADAERIKSAARRIARSREDGNQVVAVVSAMGDTTDDLISQAHTVTDNPDPRELALLLSTGEIVSCTLVTMALRALGYNAIGLSGGQAGIRTSTDYTRARIVDIDPSRILAELREDRIVVVARVPGRHGGQRGYDAGPRSFGHHGRRSRRGPGGTSLRDLHRRGRHLHSRSKGCA